MAIELTNAHDFDDVQSLVADVGKFLRAFTGLPVGDEDERIETIELLDFDVGSKWLLVKTSGIAALRFLGTVFRAIVYLLDWGRQKTLETKLLESAAEDTRTAVELNKLEHRIPFLATTASITPFIGLFGTVWGIVIAFQGIAAAGNTSLGVVAQPIAEALPHGHVPARDQAHDVLARQGHAGARAATESE